MFVQTKIDRSLRSCNKQCCATAVNNIGKESRSCMKRHIEQKLYTYIEKLLNWKLSQNLNWKSENVQCLNSHQISHSHCQSGLSSFNCCSAYLIYTCFFLHCDKKFRLHFFLKLKDERNVFLNRLLKNDFRVI